MTQRKYGWPPPTTNSAKGQIELAKVIMYDVHDQMVYTHTFTPVMMQIGDTINLVYNITYTGTGLVP